MQEGISKNTNKNVDPDQVGTVLDYLYNSSEFQPEKQKRNSLRRTIQQNAGKIASLQEVGWTGKEICRFLRDKLGIQFSDASFYNYYNMHGNQRKKKKITINNIFLKMLAIPIHQALKRNFCLKKPQKIEREMRPITIWARFQTNLPNSSHSFAKFPEKPLSVKLPPRD